MPEPQNHGVENDSLAPAATTLEFWGYEPTTLRFGTSVSLDVSLWDHNDNAWSFEGAINIGRERIRLPIINDRNGRSVDVTLSGFNVGVGWNINVAEILSELLVKVPVPVAQATALGLNQAGRVDVSFESNHSSGSRIFWPGVGAPPESAWSLAGSVLVLDIGAMAGYRGSVTFFVFVRQGLTAEMIYDIFWGRRPLANLLTPLEITAVGAIEGISQCGEVGCGFSIGIYNLTPPDRPDIVTARYYTSSEEARMIAGLCRMSAFDRALWLNCTGPEGPVLRDREMVFAAHLHRHVQQTGIGSWELGPLSEYVAYCIRDRVMRIAVDLFGDRARVRTETQGARTSIEARTPGYGPPPLPDTAWPTAPPPAGLFPSHAPCVRPSMRLTRAVRRAGLH